MLGLLIGATILGIIITVMEDGHFPGWLPMIGSLLAIVIPATIVNTILPPQLFIVGLAVGAITGGCAISFLCGMGVKRSAIAASIYLAAQIGISFAFQALT